MNENLDGSNLIYITFRLSEGLRIQEIQGHTHTVRLKSAVGTKDLI